MQKYENYQSFLSENFQFLEVKFSIYLNRRVFVMYDKIPYAYPEFINMSVRFVVFHFLMFSFDNYVSLKL